MFPNNPQAGGFFCLFLTFPIPTSKEKQLTDLLIKHISIENIYDLLKKWFQTPKNDTRNSRGHGFAVRLLGVPMEILEDVAVECLGVRELSR